MQPKGTLLLQGLSSTVLYGALAVMIKHNGELKVRGVPLLKNRLSDFQTLILGSEVALVHCHSLLKTPYGINHTMKNLTRVTSVTDVFAEMFEQKSV